MINGNLHSYVGLDQHLASVISREMPTDIFSPLMDLKSNSGATKKSTCSKYPTLIHWAAYKGLDKSVIALLDLPGAITAAQQLNCNERSASEMAKIQGHLNLSILLESKTKRATAKTHSGNLCTQNSNQTGGSEIMHEYEYPLVKLSSNTMQTNGLEEPERKLSDVLPVMSDISPPPTPPSLSKMYDLRDDLNTRGRNSCLLYTSDAADE